MFARLTVPFAVTYRGIHWFFFVYGLVSGAVLEARAGSDLIESFGARHGLIDNHITAIHEDDSGVLWIGTRGKPVRFDGFHFESLERRQTGNIDRALGFARLEPGKVVVITGTGAFLYTDTGVRRLFQTDQSGVQAYHLDARTRLWLSTGNEIFAIDREGDAIRVPDGLADRAASFFFEDRKGRIWAGIRRVGLALLDEVNWKWNLFGTDEGLPSDMVTGLYQDRSGRLWVSTLRGAAFFGDGRIERAPFNAALPSPTIYGFAEDDKGDLWINPSRGGLVRWDGSRAALITREDGLADDMISDMYRDRRGGLWLISNHGVSLYRHGRFKTLSREDGLSSDLVTHVYEGSGGVIWIGTASGLNRYEESGMETLISDPSSEAFPFWSMGREIYRDGKGRLWFPSLKGLGLSDGQSFHLLTKDQGLPSDTVHEITEDGQGGIWVGTEKGLAVDGGEGFHEVPSLRDKKISGLTVDAGNRIWALDINNKLYVSEENGPGPRSFEIAAQFSGVWRLQPGPDGDLWVLEKDSLTRFPQKGLKQTVVRFSEQPNTALFRDGAWWIGTRGGLYRLVDHDLHPVFPKPFIGRPVTRILAGPPGEFWLVLSDPSEVIRYRETDGRILRFDVTLSANPEDHIQPDGRGSLWYFYRDTLIEWDGWQTRRVTLPGLFSGALFRSLLRIDEDTLWLATNEGLHQYKVSMKMVSSLTRDDGLADHDVYDLDHEDRNGLWIRTRGGVQRFKVNTAGPKLSLTSLYDGEEPLPVEPGLALEHHRNNLIFNLEASRSKRMAGRVQYAYRLIGENDSWSDITREPRLHFPGLAPGRYRLQVTAYNRDLVPGQPVSFNFTILSPIWLRPWFLILAGCALAFLIFGVYRFMLTGKLEKARILNELMTANRMQMSLMPKSSPQAPGLQVSGLCIPAREVGGDFFDWSEPENNRQNLGFTIMDVSGKSMEAAIISVMASGLINGEISHWDKPAEVLAKVNGPLYQKTPKKLFVTGLVASIFLSDRCLVWANAGHPHPLIIRAGAVVKPDNPRSDLPLGVLAQWSYHERRLPLESDDLVVVYTDGITEAMNRQKQFFGLERMAEFFATSKEKGPDTLVRNLLDEVLGFTDGQPQHDDMTLIAIRVGKIAKDQNLP